MLSVRPIGIYTISPFEEVVMRKFYFAMSYILNYLQRDTSYRRRPVVISHVTHNIIIIYDVWYNT